MEGHKRARKGVERADSAKVHGGEEATKKRACRAQIRPLIGLGGVWLIFCFVAFC